MIDRAAIALAVWSLGLLFFNPWLEGRKRLIAMIACAAAATICFIAGGVQ